MNNDELRASIAELRDAMRVSNGELRASIAELRASIAELRDTMRVNHDSLHANLGELFEAMQRHDSQIAEIRAQTASNSSQIATNSSQIAQLITASRQDAEAIRALARIAESHERRISGLEGEGQ